MVRIKRHLVTHVQTHSNIHRARSVSLPDVLSPSTSTKFKSKHAENVKMNPGGTGLISSISKNSKVRTKTKKKSDYVRSERGGEGAARTTRREGAAAKPLGSNGL